MKGFRLEVGWYPSAFVFGVSFDRQGRRFVLYVGPIAVQVWRARLVSMADADAAAERLDTELTEFC